MTIPYAIRGGYGKHFASMYTGSLVGEGPLAFALMGYVIANQKPIEEFMGVEVDKVKEDRALVVELNPKLLSAIIGHTTEEEVTEEIEKLCGEDKGSRSGSQNGKRLVRVGSFAYWVVNGRSYREARIKEERREQNRRAQARHRERVKGSSSYSERAHEKTEDPEEARRFEELRDKVPPGTYS